MRQHCFTFTDASCPLRRNISWQETGSRIYYCVLKLFFLLHLQLYPWHPHQGCEFRDCQQLKNGHFFLNTLRARVKLVFEFLAIFSTTYVFRSTKYIFFIFKVCKINQNVWNSEKLDNKVFIWRSLNVFKSECYALWFSF